MRLLVALVVTFTSLASFSALALQGSIEQERQLGSLIRQGLLDPEVPLAARRGLAKQFEDVALQSGPTWLYVLGSLYRVGEDNTSSPFPKDIDRAREYLSRAALRGEPNAMAKLVFLEVDAGNRFESNVWAQLYIHYSSISRPQRDDSGGGVGATVLGVAQDGFPKKDIERLEQRVIAMITAYDAPIRQGIDRALLLRAGNPLSKARGDRCYPTGAQYAAGRVRGKSLRAGGAEYFVTFEPDGRVGSYWMLDAWPNIRVERSLRGCVETFRVTLDQASAGKDFVAILPVMVTDPALRLRAKDE